jgi:large subunit ribosomal protein L6
MSRIGKKEIAIPSGVTVALDGQAISVKGPKGELAYTAPEEIVVANENGSITFTPRDDSQRAKAMWGLSRTLTNNMVEGVTKGYEEVLELVGVGYRAALKGKDLNLQLGYSHEIDMPPPEGISFAVPRPVEVRIAGIDKQMVGEVAARIRRLRPPEPYKGKGVRYQGEKVRRKEGKKK